LNKAEISSLRIDADMHGDSGIGVLALNTDRMLFNHFGDRKVASARPLREITIKLARICHHPSTLTIFKITSLNTDIYEPVFIVMQRKPYNFCLLVLGELKHFDRTASTVERTVLSSSLVWPLFDEHALDRKEGKKWQSNSEISIRSAHFPSGEPGTTRLVLFGRLGGRGRLLNDRTNLRWAWAEKSASFTNGVQKTTSDDITFIQVKLPDPAGQDRRLYKIEHKLQSELGELYLVLSPTADGPHRLIVSEDDTTKHVVPLTSQAIYE
jgi:hypothetical protein